MTFDELHAHCEENDGWCLGCKAVTQSGGCEPDARKYRCPECGEYTLYGMEEAAAIMMVVPLSAGDGDDFEPGDVDPATFDSENDE